MTTTEMSQDNSQDSWRAPYMSYATLANFLDTKIASGSIPPRIDPPFLEKYAGSVRPLLITTLKTIGMIDENGLVREPLREAVRSPEARKAVLRGWAGQFYSEQIKLASQNATAQMLWETFARHGFNGSTQRRAVIFYLGLSEDLELPVSAYFRAPKAPLAERKRSRGGGARQGRQNASDNSQASPADDVPVSAAAGVEKRIVHLEAGTVTVYVDVRWLDLPDNTFTKLRQIIKDLQALEIAGDGGDKEDAEVAS